MVRQLIANQLVIAEMRCGGSSPLPFANSQSEMTLSYMSAAYRRGYCVNYENRLSSSVRLRVEYKQFIEQGL